MAKLKPRSIGLDDLLKDNKHLVGHEKKRKLGNIAPNNVAPAVLSKIVEAVCEPLL